MSRRRNLRLPSSSDEEDTPPLPQNPNPNPHEISDDDDAFIDVPDALFDPPPPNPNPSLFTSPPPSPPMETGDDEEFIDVPDDLSDPAPQNPNPDPFISPPPSPPMEMDDYEDFVAVPDSPTAPQNPNPDPPMAADDNADLSGPAPRNPHPDVDRIEDILRRLGLRLRREWLESCILALERSGPGFGAMGADQKAKSCFEQFLLSDMSCSSAGMLPANLSRMHKAELEGPFVLQVDEIVNICSSLRERYHDAPAGLKRCLKLSLTDGIQRVFAMEYRPIRDLNVFAPAGLKVVVRNIHIRRGLLMLVPEVTEFLGGLVEDLEEARRRLVDEVNKPPRSKRKLTIPPLSERATLAAWPSRTTNIGPAQANIPVRPPRTTSNGPAQANISVQPSWVTNSGLAQSNIPVQSSRTASNGPAQANIPVQQSWVTNNGLAQSNIPVQSSSTANNRSAQANIPVQPSWVTNNGLAQSNIPVQSSRTANNGLAQANIPVQPSWVTNNGLAQANIPVQSSRTANNGPAQANISVQIDSNNSDRTCQDATMTSFVSVAETTIIEDHHVGDIGQIITEESTTRGIEENTLPEFVDSITVSIVEEVPPTNSIQHADPNTTVSATEMAEDTNMLDVEDAVADVEHPLILCGDNEMPFTYLACLLAKWVTQKDHTPFIQGTIKCILTGVKRFQYKERSTYALQVYVDDGSLINEVTIDHQVVEKGIGHPPQEVTAALSSSNKQTTLRMRETMKRFQLFLATFEGMMLVEINEDSPFPIVREMSQGCSTSDALLVLKRLKLLNSPPELPQRDFNPIDLSP